MANTTRSGYSSGSEKPVEILKRKRFAKWQASEKLSDAALCEAVKEMESGLIDADLGGLLYKQRVARPGAGKVFLDLPALDLAKALQSGVLLEVHCGEQDY